MVGRSVLKDSSSSLCPWEGGGLAGRVSMGFMQATPGEMKLCRVLVSECDGLRLERVAYSLRSSAERMADIFNGRRKAPLDTAACGSGLFRCLKKGDWMVANE